MSSYPELSELIWLFEAEPSVEYEDIGWPASEATFVTVRGAWTVTCTIAPYLYTVIVTLAQGDDDVVRLAFPELVHMVAVDRTHGIEALVVSSLRDSWRGAIRLQLKPSISVTFDAQPLWASD